MIIDPRRLNTHLWLFQAGVGRRAVWCDLGNNGGLSEPKKKKKDKAFGDNIAKNCTRREALEGKSGCRKCRVILHSARRNEAGVNATKCSCFSLGGTCAVSFFN